MFNKFKNRLQGYPEDLSGKLKKDEEPYKPADLDKMTAGLVETENRRSCIVFWAWPKKGSISLMASALHSLSSS